MLTDDLGRRSLGEGNETPLSGGCLTTGVVRVGDTVRRPRSAASPFVGRLLRHLEACGFAGAPRYLGRDEQGRDTLSYLPGEVPARWRAFTDEKVCDAARLLRAYHDATRGSSLTDGFDVVCHHDPGSNNVVFREGRPVALIDFDFAAPGAALEDLGYLAWSWCVSSKPERGPVATQAQQVRVLADAYEADAPTRLGLVDAIRERQWRNIGFWRAQALKRVETPTSPEKMAERIVWSQREHAYTSAHRDLFAAALR